MRRDIRWHRAATYPSRDVLSFCAVYAREITIRRRIATLARRLNSARKELFNGKIASWPAPRHVMGKRNGLRRETPLNFHSPLRDSPFLFFLFFSFFFFFPFFFLLKQQPFNDLAILIPRNRCVELIFFSSFLLSFYVSREGE